MTREEILSALVSGKITNIAEAAALLESLTPSRAVNGFSMKVSEKGAIAFRGIPGSHHVFGTTLYAKGVLCLLEHEKEIRAFVESNRARLSWEKPVKAAA
jgi:hypothetical protein